MALRTPRAHRSPNVAISSGDVYPNGVDISPANPDIQATVRPFGWLFRPSAGYETVRVGAHRLDIAHPHGQGIDFTPLRLAEDITKGGQSGPPMMVDPATSSRHADVADIPGSEYLDDEGKVPGWMAAENRGMYLADAGGVPDGGASLHHGNRVLRDMGDRDPLRPLTRAAHGYLVNPAGAFREDWRENPLMAVGAAAAIVGVLYMVASNFERSYRSRRGRSVAGAAGAVPAATVDTAGATVSDTARAANTALTSAGEAVETAVSAAGDAVEAAGKAVEKTGDAAADAVKAD